MERSNLFDSCEHLLSVLCTRIEMRGKLNLLNLHIHCEDFYAGLLNRLFALQLTNINAYEQNSEGIDLLDASAKVLLQVSATATKAKVTSALSKDLAAYKGHRFRFMSISKDAAHLRKETYANPHELAFNPADDIYDVTRLLNIILHMDLAKQRDVYDFLKAELSDAGMDRLREESNLATIINIISREDLGVSPPATPTDFNVDEKVAFNGLGAAAGVIEDYKIFHPIVDRIYTEFDNSAVNKSRSVLDAFRATYHRLSTKYVGDELFFQIVEHVIMAVKESSNYSKMPAEELQMCVSILAVDAFIRCKIFRNPSEVGHAAA